LLERANRRCYRELQNEHCQQEGGIGRLRRDWTWDRNATVGARAKNHSRGELFEVAGELTVLLDSSSSELVSIGLWILSELHFELYDTDRFVSRLRALLDHEDPAVRFNALSAIYPALNWQEAATRALVEKLRSDPNEGVRSNAERVAARLSLVWRRALLGVCFARLVDQNVGALARRLDNHGMIMAKYLWLSAG
jgi:hypothetical protein